MTKWHIRAFFFLKMVLYAKHQSKIELIDIDTWLFFVGISARFDSSRSLSWGVPLI